jgi:hypothetical protein
MTSKDECPTCGETFSSEFGVKQHHTKTHGESIAGKVVDCDNCGDTVRKKPNRIKNWDNHFCGNECRFEYKRGENHHQHNRITVICDNCGDETEKRPCRVERSEKNFCNMSCRNEFYEKSGMWSGESSPSWTGGKETSVCKQCNSTYEHVKSRDSKFCSRSCKGDWMSKNMIGEDHPRWKNTNNTHYKYYGHTWRDKREKIISLDNCKCQECGSGENLLVHHVIPLRTFDNVNDAHYKENLVTLCWHCHGKIEKLEQENQIEKLNVPRLEI